MKVSVPSQAMILTAFELAGQVKQLSGVASKDQVSRYYRFHEHTHTFRNNSASGWPDASSNAQLADARFGCKHLMAS